MRFGCFGKLPYPSAKELSLQVGDELWHDAVAFGKDGDNFLTIDAVTFDVQCSYHSLAISILHAMNDIFVSGGVPTAISVSFIYRSFPPLESLKEVSRNLAALCKLLEVKLCKIHTSSGGERDTITIAVFGTRVIQPEKQAIGNTGRAFLFVDKPPYDTPTEVDVGVWARHVFSSRLAFARTFPGVMKDVSGDGLAGALLQLSERLGIAIRIDVDNVPLPRDIIRIDDCYLDKNYADYCALLENFCGKSDNSRSRRLLFEPALFGPLLGVSSEPYSSNIDACSYVIGEFEVSSPKVILR